MKKKIYVSFDIENDYDLIGMFKEDVDQYDYPYEIIATSVEASLKSEEEITEIIKTCDLFIIICGYKTDKAKNVDKEFNQAINSAKKYMFLNGRNDLRITTPKRAAISDVIYSWNYQNMNLLYQKIFYGANA